jgi:signal transduction histidine kinase
MSNDEFPELLVLKDVLQTIGDVKADVFSAVAERLYQDLLKGCKIFVFGLDLVSLSFVQVFPQTEHKIQFKILELGYTHDHRQLIEEIIESLKHTDLAASEQQLVVRPIYSLGILRAIVVVQRPGRALDDERRILFMNTVSRTFLWILERDRLLRIFNEFQVPINFRQGEVDYFADLMKLIRSATQMPFIAIREHIKEDSALKCIAQAGFDNLVPSDLDIENFGSSQYRVFYECIHLKQAYNAKKYDDCPEIFEKLRSYGVKSFLVVPVLVGSEVFGTLSFACGIENYEFSMLETAGFEALANAVGLSITNFRNFNRQVEDEREAAIRDMALVAVEIAQYARHEARNHIEEGEAILELLHRNVRKVQGAEKLIDDIKLKFRDLDTALDRIKEATVAPSDEARLCLLSDVWKKSFSQVQYKLDREHIRYYFDGNAKDAASVIASFDHLRLTFSQLVLNSIDAFQRQGTKNKDKQIRVDIIDPGLRANFYIIKYKDNAGGIDPSKLRKAVASDDFSQPLPSTEQAATAIFRRGITSKGKQGSGYGLFLARKKLLDLDGSIDLTEYRGGTTIFEIRLPKPQPHDLRELEKERSKIRG